jgi:hypothetical protein
MERRENFMDGLNFTQGTVKTIVSRKIGTKNLSDYSKSEIVDIVSDCIYESINKYHDALGPVMKQLKTYIDNHK